MNVLLVGNLPEDRQESMRRFTELLRSGLTLRGHAVTSMTPELRFGRLAGPYRYGGVPKYLGYLDKFVLFPRQLRKRIAAVRPDVVHITDHSNSVYVAAAGRAPVLVTCHDLLQVRAARGEFSHQSVSGSGRRYQAWVLRSLCRAPLIACVSTKTFEDVVKLTGLPAARVSVAPNALNHPYRSLNPTITHQKLAALASAQGIDAARFTPACGGFLLNVGGAHWYKNRPGLLAIFAELRRQLSPSPALVMVGPPLSAEETRQATALRISGDLVSLPMVTNDQLEALYNAAEGLIFPSWEEGFGWPVAEAQACGCPVFASNRAPMTEVGGTAAVYFDPGDPAGAARVIAAAWPGRTGQRERGRVEVERWRPEIMLAAYEKLYARLAPNARAQPGGSP